MSPLLSLSDAAAQLGLTKASLRTEIRKGRLTPISIAGKFYVTEALLTEQGVGGSNPLAPTNT